jgi:hypothetical protein
MNEEINKLFSEGPIMHACEQELPAFSYMKCRGRE